MKIQSIKLAVPLRAMALLAAAITMASAAEGEQEFKASATAPATNYKISISGVYQVKKEIWVISKVEQVGDFGGQALTLVSDMVKVKTSDLPSGEFKVIHKVSGRAVKGGGAGVISPEIQELGKRIAKMKRFAAIARFTPDRYREFQANLSALEKQLEKLTAIEDGKNNVEYISGDSEKQLEKALEEASKIPFKRTGKQSVPTRPGKNRKPLTVPDRP